MRLGRVLLSEFRYFKRYMEREMLKNHQRATWKPVAGWKFVGGKRRWHFDENRPWTEEFKRNNAPGVEKRPVPVMPIKDWKIFKGDRVEVLVGRDKGKQGIVSMIVKERNWVYVEGLNCEYKMQTAYSKGPPSCAKTELPLLLPTQIQLVDPSDEKPCKVEWRYTEEGEKVRVSVRSGRIIPKPPEASVTEDYVYPKTYQECSKDMTEKEVLEVSYEPKIMSFEAEVMEALGIKEHRKKAKTYWY